MHGKGIKKRACSIDEIAIRIDQDNINNSNNVMPQAMSQDEKHRDNTPPPQENRFKIQEKIENLETQCKELRGSLQKVISEVHDLKSDVLTQCRDMATKINEKSHKTLSEFIHQNSQKIQIHDDRLKVLEHPPPPIIKKSIQEHEPPIIKKSIQEPPPTTTRVLRRRDGAIAKTSSKFHETTSEEEEEDEDEEDEDEEDENKSKCSEKFEETLLKWNTSDDSGPSMQQNEEEEGKEGDTDGIHNTLHELILCLRSRVYKNHEDLDVIVHELKKMTRLEYPSDEDVSTRQALILKVISCFYQIICVVSMERGISCEQIYKNEDFLHEALDKVQAII